MDLMGLDDPGESPVKMGSPVKLERDRVQNGLVGLPVRHNQMVVADEEPDPLFAFSDALKDITVECSRVKDGCTFK